LPADASPLEKAILKALATQGCTASDLAGMVGMAPTNFSLARNSKRPFPLPALLGIFKLANLKAEEQVKILEWVAFKQEISPPPSGRTHQK